MLSRRQHRQVHENSRPIRVKNTFEFIFLEEDILLSCHDINTVKSKFGSTELTNFMVSVKEDFLFLNSTNLNYSCDIIFLKLGFRRSLS